MIRKGYLHSGILLISAATLMFELNLTRLFAVAEWYHFAFLSVSVALLGYAGSGTLLSLMPPNLRHRLAAFSIALPLSLVGSFLIINLIPFDSYQLAWSPRQIIYLIIHYASLVIPFGISGFLVAYWMSRIPEHSNTIYAANLIGSGIGSASLLVALPALGGEGTVMAAASLAALGITLLSMTGNTVRVLKWVSLALAGTCALFAFALPPWAVLRPSPYKSLSYALLASDAHLGYQRWNAYSRIDVVESQRIHSAPGLSLNYRGQLPPQHGLTVDGDNLSTISRRIAPGDTNFLAYLPSSLPYLLRPQASALIIRPRGGMDVAVALDRGARRVIVVEDNPLIVQALQGPYSLFIGGLYEEPRVSVVIEDGRSVLQRSGEQFDIIQFSLAESFHPLTSGTYSLTENHLYTIEALTSALRRLDAGGMLVITRWLQDPPSESIRAGALMIAALNDLNMRDPKDHLVALRSWSTMTLLASPYPFKNSDIDLILSACQRLSYDIVHYPGMQREEANRYNVLPQPLYYTAFQNLLHTHDPRAFYRAQSYDISPPSDDRPFFGHYFRWQQTPQIVVQLGKTWQPFGGSGFLLVLALLIISILAAALLILLPLLWKRGQPQHIPSLWRILCYFAALGLGYLLVEMPLMQQFILYLGHAALSFIVVLSALLLFSGIGSVLAHRANLRVALVALIVALAIYPALLRWLFDATLSMALPSRVAIAAACLLPLGILMGIPFAKGMQRIEERIPGLIPWIWAINGGASVVSSVLAAVLALSAGYRLVLVLATSSYLGAALAFWPLTEPRRGKEN